MTLYDRPTVTVSGFPALWIGSMARRAIDKGEGRFAQLPDHIRADIYETVRWLLEAGQQSDDLNRRAPMSAAGHADIVGHADSPQWLPDALTAEEAADMLDLTPRQVRRYGETLGVKVSGRWMFDPTAVAAELRRRGDEAGAA